MLQTAVTTLKPLPTPIRPFLVGFGVNVPTAGASFRRVSWWNKNNVHSSNCGFVLRESSQLIERPIVSASSLCFGAWLLVETFPNIGQVFKRQRSTNPFCGIDQTFTDVVIQPLLKARFAAFKPSQKSTTIPSAFALNRSSDLAEMVTSSLNLFPTPTVASGSGGNVAPTQINPDHFGRFARRWGFNIDANIHIVFALAGFANCCRSWLLTSQQCDLVSTNRQLEVMTLRQSYPYFLLRFNVLKRALIQANRSGAELVNLLHRFFVANHATNRHANMIGTQPNISSDISITKVMELCRVPATRFLPSIQNPVTRIRESLQSLIHFGSQLFRDYQLTFNRYCLHLKASELHPDYSRIRGSPAAFPATKVARVDFPPLSKAQGLPTSRTI